MLANFQKSQIKINIHDELNWNTHKKRTKARNSYSQSLKYRSSL